MIAQRLHAAIEAVCPILGVSIGRIDDKATWRIDFKDEATPQQRTAAQSVVDSFDPFAPPTVEEIEAEARQRFQTDKLFRAKCISDLAFRLGKLPGQLTTSEIDAERDRIAVIYRAI